MKSHSKNIYTLSRAWFDHAYENPEMIKPNHTALYFFCIEHCNRLGWKEKFGLPTTMAKEAIGIKSYNTYKNTLDDLVEWRFVDMIERSKNQYSSNIIALSNFNKALDKALDKALIKHASKQSESTRQSIGSINKQYTILQINKLTKHHEEVKIFLESILLESEPMSPQKNEDDYRKKLLSELDSSLVPNKEHYEITLAFYELFKMNLEELGINNSSLKKAKGSWIDQVRLMIDQDERTIDEIREVFSFLKMDEFWKQNIRSTSKLREKFEQLLIKSRNGAHKKHNRKNERDWGELAGIISGHCKDL